MHEPAETPIFVAPRNKALPLFGIGLGFAVFGASKLIAYIFGGKPDERLNFLGYAIILISILDLIKRGPRFVISESYFACHSVGGIGRVAWAEVKTFRKQSLFGYEHLVFEAVDWKKFWSQRRGLDYLLAWPLHFFFRKGISVSWNDFAESIEEAAEIMNSYVPVENSLHTSPSS